MAATVDGSFQATVKTLKEAISPDSKAQALTSFRRSQLENQKVLQNLSDEDFCELCNSIIDNCIENCTDAGVTENMSSKLYLETCRTLDIILPETKNKKYDFFQSILQINRKKRLKILISLSILKDETVAVIARKLSILNFLKDCMESIQPKTMPWLLSENADNVAVMKTAENKVLNENEEYEEKIVERALLLLSRLNNLTAFGLSINQFDTFIMDKVILLAYMGHRKQRTTALIVLKQSIENDLGTRVRSFNREIWEKYKTTLQNVYCKRMTLLVNASDFIWATQWESSIALIGTDLHRGSALVNSLLKVEELAFKSADPNRRQAFLSWKLLIDNFALDPRELATNRRIKLLCVPLNAKNSKNEQMVLTKLEVWWHLIYRVYPSLSECIDSVLIPFLNLCFGPFGDKPLFIPSDDSSVSLGKKFVQTQIFAIDAFAQLIVCKEDQSKISISVVQEKLSNPVNNSIFEKVHKIFIHCFGESILILGYSSDGSIQNKANICKILWNSLIKRIEQYDKMKVSMYKEVFIVISELVKHQLQKVPLVKDFLLNVFLKDFDNIAKSAHFTENVLLELSKIFIQPDNLSSFRKDHYKPIESLLMHLVKPSHADVYYPQTLELLQTILKVIDEARKFNVEMETACEMWCILARIAKKYIEDSQNFNEGTLLKPNFKVIESLIAFPFASLKTNDLSLLKVMADTWCGLYKQFDFQAELIVTVKPNEILEKTSEMIASSLENNMMCCDFAAVCIDGLLDVVNYDKDVPQFVQLLRNLTLQCLRSNSLMTDKVLKALSSFLLRVFTHCTKKTALYLKNIEPAVKFMLTKLDDNCLEQEILNIWVTIVGLFKKLQKSLNHELLNCYRQTIIAAASNPITFSAAYSILELKDSVDEKSKKLLEDLAKEFEKISNLNNTDSNEIMEKTKKKNTPINSFINRKTTSPSTRVTSVVHNGKENFGKSKVTNYEPDSQDFVVINTDIKLDVNRLTDHQKEMFKKRRDDIPAMYNELTVSNSQDSQQIQKWFDVKSTKSPIKQKKEISLNNNESSKTSPMSLHFKNIVQTLPNNQEKNLEKPETSVASPKVQPQKRTENAEILAIVESPKKKELEPAPNVAKKLDFETHGEDEQTSPSIIESVKMRRKNPGEDNNGPGTNQDKSALHSRRSLQPEKETIKKSNSADQLTRRARKRRNSDSNSENVLNIERIKKPRLVESAEISKSESDKSTANSKSSNSNSTDNKKENNSVSKRTQIEMSRLKIDMRFETLPNRRSMSKNSESSSSDKKTTLKDEKSKEEKTASPAKSHSSKTETNNQQQSSQSTVNTRRSLRSIDTLKIDSNEKEIASIKKDNGDSKKPSATENSEMPSKCTARKSLPGKSDIAVFKKKVEATQDTQEVVHIEDASTQIESPKKVQSPAKTCTELENDESTLDIRPSQDPDIVESSQEPSMNSKLDKAECFIKIKKVELVQNHVSSQKASEKEEKETNTSEKIVDETNDAEDKSISIIPATIDFEKCIPPAVEIRKIDNNSSKSTSSSPKSSHTRLFKSKAFPMSGRAAQMLGLVTKQSIAEKLASDSSKADYNLTDEVTIVPLKKDKPTKEHERLGSPISSSRQEKIFNNMNNLNNLKPERCSSPSITMFCNLKNDGERISPKLERHQHEKEKEKESDCCSAVEKEASSNEMSDASDDSPKKKELPMLEWSNANPPSLTASPSASILKRMPEIDIDTPNRKKRVSFADPPVSREMGYEIMTETSSPPRLEKLPTSRSPVSRRDMRRQRRRLEKDNDLNSIEEKLANNEAADETNNTSDVPIPASPKMKLATVLSKMDVDEPKIDNVQDNLITPTQDVDMFEDNSAIINSNDVTEVKTSTQNDKNNSSIKLDSINLSNILQKSMDNNQSVLEDTVDIQNLSSSLDSIPSDKPGSMYGMNSKDQTDTLPVTDSVFSNPGFTQESQSSVAQLNEPENLDSTLPIYPLLASCSDAVDSISAELVDPLFTNHLAKHFSMKSIRSVGDLAQLTERDINRLPIKSPKIACVKNALSRYQEKLVTKTPEKKSKTPVVVSSSTPLGNKRRDKSKQGTESFEDLVKCSNSCDLESASDSSVYECRKRSPRRSVADNSMQTSPVKRLKRDEEKACADLMDKCDDEFLFNQFAKRFNFERALQGYNIGSKELVDILIKKLSQEKEKETGSNGLTSDVDLQQLLNKVPTDLIMEQIKAREELKCSETLLNLILDNSVDKLSGNTKRTIFNTIAERIDSFEFVDMYADLLKSKIRKIQEK